MREEHISRSLCPRRDEISYSYSLSIRSDASLIALIPHISHILVAPKVKARSCSVAPIQHRYRYRARSLYVSLSLARSRRAAFRVPRRAL